MKNDVLIVIRSVGERTVEKCRSMIVSQGVPTQNIEVVNESPFSKALLKSYMIGIERGKKWTLCVDGDLLLRSEAIEKMVSFIEKTNEDIFEIQGFVIDKFFGGPRVGGIHLYRTSLLPIAVEKLPKNSDAIRPEANTLREMEKSGHLFLVLPYIVGLHDFEQSYSDIYRKSFVYGRKHKAYYQMFIKRWSRLSELDKDYAVAIEGLIRGYKYAGDIISTKAMPDIDSEFLLPESKEAEIHIDQRYVDNLCLVDEFDEEFTEHFPVPFINVRFNGFLRTKCHQVFQVYRRLGFYSGSKMLCNLVISKLARLRQNKH